MAKSLDPSVVVTKKAPRILVAACSLIGVAAATIVAAFREKQAGDIPPGNSDAAKSSTALPELTEEQKNDYRVLVGLSEAYLDDGNYANALATIETLLFTYPQARNFPQYSLTRALALIGLERKEEAIEELKSDVHFCANIAASTTRHSIWLSLREWAEAEKDLTRVIEKFGPNTMLLYLRAEARILQKNMSGADDDKKSALAIKPDDLQQQNLVHQLWAPLETKYPEYAEHRKTIGGDTPSKTPPKPDPWVIQHWDRIAQDITTAPPSLSADAKRGRLFMAERIKGYFQAGNYLNALVALEEVFYSLPHLAHRPVLSLFRALLYSRLDQPEKFRKELERSCHKEVSVEDLELRVYLLDILNEVERAESLCTQFIDTIDLSKIEAIERNPQPWLLRGMTRANLGKHALAEEDRSTCFTLVRGITDENSIRDNLEKSWEAIETHYPAYAEFRKTLPEK